MSNLVVFFQDDKNAEIFFYSKTPVRMDFHSNDSTSCSSTIFQGLESSLFGRGRASGATFIGPNMDSQTNSSYGTTLSAYPMMIFDDIVSHPNNILGPMTSMHLNIPGGFKHPNVQVTNT